MNVAQYFLGNKGTSTGTNVSKNILPTGITYNGISSNASSNMWRYIKQGLSYLFGIAVIIFIIMLFVHFFITPVFSSQPGSPGIITVPGLDNGVLFWNKSSPEVISNSVLPIKDMDFGYSFIMDIFIINPHVHFSTHPRILFRRGGTLKQTPSGITLAGIIDNYNIVGALLPDTNDLLISVLSADNNTENVIIPNIPVQEPFRIGVVLMNQAMEVYINGHLMKTRAFTTPPKSVKGDFYPGTISTLAKLQNFKVWASILSSPEIRYAKPDMPSGAVFGSAMPQTSTCSASSASSNDMPNAAYNATNAVNTDNGISRRVVTGRAFLNTMS